MPRVALASPCRPGPWEIFRLHLQIEPTKAETFKERCIPKFASRPTATLALSARPGRPRPWLYQRRGACHLPAATLCDHIPGDTVQYRSVH